VESAKHSILQFCKNIKVVEGKLESSSIDNLSLEIEALLGVALRTNSQSFILEQLKFIFELKRHLKLDSESETSLCETVSSVFDKFFEQIPQEHPERYHAPGSLWSSDPFVIMKKVHFQKYPGLAYYTIATDGNYLYFYVSAVNGGMFKIGTGNGGTKAGKIYLEKQLYFPIGTKVDEVSWVYLKGKLYLRTSSRDPWMLEMIDPNSFNK
jgi:hypothetical protein